MLAFARPLANSFRCLASLLVGLASLAAACGGATRIQLVEGAESVQVLEKKPAQQGSPIGVVRGASTQECDRYAALAALKNAARGERADYVLVTQETVACTSGPYTIEGVAFVRGKKPQGGSTYASRGPLIRAPSPDGFPEPTRAPPFPPVKPRPLSDFGALKLAELVASSGWLTRSGAELEISVSPRDAEGEFMGAALGLEAFRFDEAAITPVRGGVTIPLQVQVERVDVAPAGSGSHDLIVLFDSSGSMRDNDGDRAGRIAGAQAILKQLDGEQHVAMLDFGNGTSGGLAAARVLQDFTSDPALLQQALSHIAESGGTPMYKAILDCMGLLRARSGGGTVVVLTDGAAEDNSLHPDVVTGALQQGVTLFTVGLGAQTDFRRLRALAVDTHGAFVEATDASQLAAAFGGVGAGVAHGRVRVIGRGSYLKPPTPGHYAVRGTLVTHPPGSTHGVRSPFEFQADL